MNEKEFLEKLEEYIKELDGRTPSYSEITEYFGDVLNKDQANAVLVYINSKQTNGSLTDADLEYLEYYTRALPDTLPVHGKRMSECTAGEVIGFHQGHVVDTARRLHREGFEIEELISEGNLALVEIVNGLSHLIRETEETLGEDGELSGRFMAYVEDTIQTYIDDILEQNDSDEKVVLQANLLNDAIDRLREETGTAPNIDELANELGISQQKVLDIIKLAGEDDDEATGAVREEE